MCLMMSDSFMHVHRCISMQALQPLLHGHGEDSWLAVGHSHAQRLQVGKPLWQSRMGAEWVTQGVASRHTRAAHAAAGGHSHVAHFLLLFFVLLLLLRAPVIEVCACLGELKEIWQLLAAGKASSGG